MTDISVRYQALLAGSEGLTGQERELLRKIEDLHGQLRAVGAGWTGEAQRAFHDNMVIFTRELENLAQVLGRTGNQLSNSAADYAAADRRGASQTAQWSI
ncbi:WXG100 family type VII secretion target [Streptomyces sp. 8K308]|uniref:WXG100 family type VII secretion target n=1 Tax=Streptomyces sp. 8K308 TaxID=2530388 RepID=UPI001051BE5D|nr:WXG100 family type VII secretion target [Streptomyces sp. 8K308]TDC20856.1 WXG100 family type VII secretion target [Streptomyces sp. 8K308]